MFFVFNILAFIITLVGSLNWGLVGIFNFNLVEAIFGTGSVMTIITYIIVLISALWLVCATFIEKGRISFRNVDKNK